MAAANNDVRILDLAISQKEHVTIDILTEEGWTPAHHAAFIENLDALSLLVENGANLSVRNKNGMCTFDQILSSDNVTLLEILWKETLAWDQNRDTNSETAAGIIHNAAGSSGTDCLEYILKRHPDGKN